MTPDPAISTIQAVFIQGCLFWLGMLGWVLVLWTLQTIKGAIQVWNSHPSHKSPNQKKDQPNGKQ